MGLTFMMAVGVNMPTIEMHLISYGIPEKYFGYWYMIYTGAYLLGSLIMTRIAINNKSTVMLTGTCMFCLSFFLLGPCPIIFERNLIIVGIGHHMMGWAGSIQYSKNYLVPLIPHMINLSHTEYHIPKDDRLNDAISGIANISICSGEILGPMIGSLLPKLFKENIKYRATYFIVSVIFGIYAIIYVSLDKLLSRRKISSKRIKMQELSVMFL